jgi:hypothetical protein
MPYTQLVGHELLPELRAADLLAKGLFTFQEFAFRHAVCATGSMNISRGCFPDIPAIGMLAQDCSLHQGGYSIAAGVECGDCESGSLGRRRV